MSEQGIDTLVNQWVRPEIKGLSAYHVPKASGLIKLDAMENPYNWPDELLSAWLGRLRGAELNRYPHPQAPGVQARLRQTMGIPEDAGLILGNGSDELIQMIAMMLAGGNRKILSVDPSFVMYSMIATIAGMAYVGVPLDSDDFSLDTEAVLSAIDQHQPAVIFLAYPNNPTGNLFPVKDLVRIIEAAPGLVVIDEAYAPFTDASFLGRVGEFANLLVMRTVSKMGLAGLRLGLLVGAPAWIDQIDKIRLPYNINILTQVSAEFALEHQTLFDRQTDAIREQRVALFSSLKTIDGIRPFPSEANFILVRMPKERAVEIHGSMRESGVLVKNLHGAYPLLADCLRLTVGTPEENQAQLAALQAALQSA
ncbi:histidinol-phosphate transaminase [Candidatus Vondammii sp. HM_W22]|uniref:histidinol-phosphate transaminase n=1 Tax=Candidatus Vondammii sp. HM_W22 TaxID=2687299 RepID=UPI001F136F14|nr:histidinol-phosphate transaminase [Candidatus Vondammii sp. HM_W22]